MIAFAWLYISDGEDGGDFWRTMVERLALRYLFPEIVAVQDRVDTGVPLAAGQSVPEAGLAVPWKPGEHALPGAVTLV